jgi:cation diffusion facilitator family transporter
VNNTANETNRSEAPSKLKAPTGELKVSMDDSTLESDALRRRASYVSLVVGVLLLGVKFWGYRLTGSQAVFSDAMESIVNVVAAGLAILVVAVAFKPADAEHPYGHGKVEFFSAAFEGGLIAFASVLICIEAVQALVRGASVHEPGIGALIVICAGFVNAGLGFYLKHVGRTHQSAALIASGEHVLSDFWTSAGVVVGLLLVQATEVKWLDPALALVVGLLLGFTGIKLVRRSIGGLLDEEDRDSLMNLLEIISKQPSQGIIQVHHCRVIRSGNYHHIDAHAVVPEFWDVAVAHERTEEFEAQIIRNYPYNGELHLHVDPCRRAYCRYCDVADCPIRVASFEMRRPVSIEELTYPEEPHEFRH